MNGLVQNLGSISFQLCILPLLFCNESSFNIRLLLLMMMHLILAVVMVGILAEWRRSSCCRHARMNLRVWMVLHGRWVVVLVLVMGIVRVVWATHVHLLILRSQVLEH